MSKFWQKKYTSKYTGAEIDAAVAKAGNLPATTSADAGKALVVDEEGKIVAGEAGSKVNVIDMDCTVKVIGGDFTVSCESQEIFEDSAAALAAVANIGEKALAGEIPLLVIHVTSSEVSSVTEGDIFVATYAETIKMGVNTLVFFSLLAPANAYMTKWQLCFARSDGTTGSAGSVKFIMTFSSTLSA